MVGVLLSMLLFEISTKGEQQPQQLDKRHAQVSSLERRLEKMWVHEWSHGKLSVHELNNEILLNHD